MVAAYYELYGHGFAQGGAVTQEKRAEELADTDESTIS